jgi:P3 major capsid protein
MAAAATASPSSQMSPAQQNQMATQALIRSAVNRWQTVQGTTTIFPASQPTISFNPINVGLIKRFVVEVNGTIANTGTTTLTQTDFGLANLFSNVQYTDLNNYLRINTNSQHLSLVANAKRRGPFGGTYDANQLNGTNRSQMLNVPPAYWPCFQAPPTIATGTSGTFRAFFEIPIAYNDKDFRGAVYANVLQAIQQLVMTPNANPVTAGTADDTFSIYTGATGSAGSISSMTVQVYQNYLDQLPVFQGNVLLPAASLSQAYLLLNSPFMGIPQGQDYPISYANQRQFLSTYATYNSTGAAGGRTLGTDVNYWALQAANAVFIWKVDPLMATILSREILHGDLPAGCYYFDSRNKAISTSQFGNVQLVLNSIVGGAAAKVQIQWEMLAPLNTLVSGASLVSN